MYKINLLPPELQQNNSTYVKKDFKRILRIITVGGIVFVLLIFYGSFLFVLNSLERDIMETEAGLAQLQGTVKQVEEVRKQRLAEEHSVKNYKKLLAERKSWSALLEEIEARLPADVWLINVDASSSGAESQAESAPRGISQLITTNPNGLTVEGYSRAVPSVGIFLNKLGHIPDLEEVSLYEIQEDSGRIALRFKITAALKESGGL